LKNRQLDEMSAKVLEM